MGLAFELGVWVRFNLAHLLLIDSLVFPRALVRVLLCYGALEIVIVIIYGRPM